MSVPDDRVLEKLLGLVDVGERELALLRRVDARLFKGSARLDSEDIAGLDDDDALAERVEAFVARFGRLQDMLGAKLLPAFLQAMGEPSGLFVENLDRAERAGIVRSADQWARIRRLRNRMIHEYVSDPAVLADALNQAHAFIPDLEHFLGAVRERLLARFPALKERLEAGQGAGADGNGIGKGPQ